MGKDGSGRGGFRVGRGGWRGKDWEGGGEKRGEKGRGGHTFS